MWNVPDRQARICCAGYHVGKFGLWFKFWSQSVFNHQGNCANTLYARLGVKVR
jgi:hypothetical protein